ncbi:phage terminase large subunit family protein [Azospirillum argentinense]|uniref:Phage terminase large subunit GpA ATPase domain-containing protein n=1 Tax=Azospirillum brasilense TaxID=192 RepID=A0A4D8Q361_AZOBR|nr:phage terminase large subunit family protein [Azospirillum argentinense]QCO00642.1 hypothetical protein D3867_00290 [Azospirillum argentinense]
MLAAEIEARALATIGAGLAPPPDLSPSQWAEAHRILDASAALHGRFSFDTTPYFRAPLEDLSTPSGIRTVVICAGAQLGKTELLLSAVLYWIANDPKPIMAVWPTVDVATRTRKSRPYWHRKLHATVIAPHGSRFSPVRISVQRFGDHVG